MVRCGKRMGNCGCGISPVKTIILRLPGARVKRDDPLSSERTEEMAGEPHSPFPQERGKTIRYDFVSVESGWEWH